ncbi:MAG TPA: diaminopimelate decarboxylase [Syntrophomonadaceae bacterium]|nr:diaminopimelate decarboxylase [Syntrophomonadaceae bacterium]HRX21542.1 diaminopimelate decarboxylase [Syntrophomonadaceae bacterium]
MFLTGTMKINNTGHLEIGGIDVLHLVKDYGSPLWVIDEQGFRDNCRSFRDAFLNYGDTMVLYASKSLCCLSICRIIDEEGLGLDVVSGGELYTALQAGFPADRIYFHGNNKSREELNMALEAGVGRIVVDNFYELELLNNLSREKGLITDILLRITPGVEAHTHEYIKTGQIDSKFGFTLTDGQAWEAVKRALQCPGLFLQGLHCHIGSQIFEPESFQHTIELMIEFMKKIKAETGYELAELDLGGGFGIYYAPGDLPPTTEKWAEVIINHVKAQAEKAGLKMPRVIIEPGRALISPAGVTLYTIGSSKEVTGIRKYIAVDGGMNDNPRPALYNARHSAIIANKAQLAADETVSVAGKCCESGDMLIWDVALPQAEAGDILAVFATGAYTYSMSSNYNRQPRPAMVLVNQGNADVIIERETYKDLIRNDRIPGRLKK